LHSSAVHNVEIENFVEMQVDQEAPNIQSSVDGAFGGSPSIVHGPVTRSSTRLQALGTFAIPIPDKIVELLMEKNMEGRKKNPVSILFQF
jgi:hypothetical protein